MHKTGVINVGWLRSDVLLVYRTTSWLLKMNVYTTQDREHWKGRSRSKRLAISARHLHSKTALNLEHVPLFFSRFPEIYPSRSTCCLGLCHCGIKTKWSPSQSLSFLPWSLDYIPLDKRLNSGYLFSYSIFVFRTLLE